MQEQFHMTVQFITHDLGVISEMADDVMVMYAGRTVEIASAPTIFSSPRHPYTKALLNSLPKFRHRVERLQTIAGSVPAPLERPRGCAFQNRCPFATKECQEQPPLIEIASGHKVACVNVDKIG
jgi:peptide/nickel transport system ATP-binding protein